MNQKSWALISVAFISALMIFSGFAGFVMRGSEPAKITTDDGWSLSEFGVGGRLIDWDFAGMGDALGMYPEDLVFAYWVNLSVSDNLTEAATMVLPPSVGMMYNNQLYPSTIERLSWGIFENDFVEFHWVKPYKRTGYGLAIPYQGYQMIPLNADLFNVMGMPTLFGTQPSIEQVLDVVSGESPTTDKFVLPYDKTDDLQIICIGQKVLDNPNIKPPFDGDYQEFYLGTSLSDDGYDLNVNCLSPGSDAEAKLRRLAEDYGLNVDEVGGVFQVSGKVEANALAGTLGTFLAS